MKHNKIFSFSLFYWRHITVLLTIIWPSYRNWTSGTCSAIMYCLQLSIFIFVRLFPQCLQLSPVILLVEIFSFFVLSICLSCLPLACILAIRILLLPLSLSDMFILALPLHPAYFFVSFFVCFFCYILCCACKKEYL
jgi:hypothetical protein